MKYLLVFSITLLTLTSYAQRLQTPSLSPSSKITQKVGLTEISVEYARPSAKGRKVMGELVPFDKIWRTGANASTKIILSEDARIGGNPIEAGTYALYTIPGEDQWTIIIHANTKMRSIAGDAYKEANDVFRFEVQPKSIAEHVESFTLQFANLRTDGLDLQLLWENTQVSFPIDVEVDQKISDQMAEFMKIPETIPHRTYFEAAQYYLNNGKDLTEAISFIDAAMLKSKDNFRYGLLKSKILERKKDRAGALKIVNQAHAWAMAAKNANYIEQTDLWRAHLEKAN